MAQAETQIYTIRRPNGEIRRIRGPANQSEEEVIRNAQRLDVEHARSVYERRGATAAPQEMSERELREAGLLEREPGYAQMPRSIAKSIGGIVDVANVMLPEAWESEKPFLGSESLMGMGRAIGLPVASYDPETSEEHIYGGLGSAASFVLPMGLAGKTAMGMKALSTGSKAGVALGGGARGVLAKTGAGSSVMGNIGRTMVQPYQAQPGMAALTELTAGAGAGLGSGIAERAESPAVRALAPLIYGLAGGIAPQIGSAASLLSPVGTGFKATRALRQALQEKWRGKGAADAMPSEADFAVIYNRVQGLPEVGDPKANAAAIKRVETWMETPEARRVIDELQFEIGGQEAARVPESERLEMAQRIMGERDVGRQVPIEPAYRDPYRTYRTTEPRRPTQREEVEAAFYRGAEEADIEPEVSQFVREKSARAAGVVQDWEIAQRVGPVGRAGQRMQEAGVPKTEMTPAQRSQSPMLLGLERAAATKSEPLTQQFREQGERQLETAKSEAERIARRGTTFGPDIGTIGDLPLPLRGVADPAERVLALRAGVTETAADIATRAVDDANLEIRKLGLRRPTKEFPGGKPVSPTEESEIFLRLLNLARKASEDVQKTIWGKTPKTKVFGFPVSRQGLTEMIFGGETSLPISQAHREGLKEAAGTLNFALYKLLNPDKRAEQLLGLKWDKKAGTGAPKSAWGEEGIEGFELHGLYSKLRETGRISRSEDKYQVAKLADDIADFVLRDLENAKSVTGASLLDNSAEGQSYASAIAYSRIYNRVFRAGKTGELLGYQGVQGELKTPPQAFLERGFTVQDPSAPTILSEAAVDVDDLRAATSLSPLQKQMAKFKPEWGGRVGSAADEAGVNFLRSRFLDHAAAGWRESRPLAAGSAEKMRGFIRANVEILDEKRFSGLKRDLQKTARVQEESEVMSSVQQSVDDALDKSVSPAAAIKTLMRNAPSQKAKDAIRLAIIRKIFNFKGDTLTPERLGIMLKDRTRSGGIEAAFNKREIESLGVLADEMDIIRNQLGELKSGKQEGILKNWKMPEHQLLEYAAGTVGARVGARFGAGTSGASLRTASRMGSMFEKTVDWMFPDQAERIIMEAIKPERKGLLAAMVTHNLQDTAADNVVNSFLSRLKESLRPILMPAWVVGMASQQMVERASDIMENRQQQ